MINLFCPINSSTGYGITSTNIWKILRNKADIALFPIGKVTTDDANIIDHLQYDISKIFQSNIKNAKCLKIWHMNDLLTSIGQGTYAVFPFFELDTIQDNEKVGLDIADIVFTPTEWSKNVLIQNGIPSNKIYKAPLGVDGSIFNELNNRTKNEDDPYVFINIGKWEIRKSHDLLVYIFNQAFSSKDNVELWMINHNPFLNSEQTQSWHKIYKNSTLGDKIKIFDRIPTHQKLAETINLADCGLYISRAEGWNNEILETMAMNKPVIVTNYSAHTEYCDANNSYLIDIDSTEKANDGIWFHGTGNWAKLGSKQIEQTVEYMRKVFKDRIRHNSHGIITSKQYCWENTVENILQHLK